MTKFSYLRRLVGVIILGVVLITATGLGQELLRFPLIKNWVGQIGTANIFPKVLGEIKTAVPTREVTTLLPSPPLDNSPHPELVPVVRVVDGDTIVVSIDETDRTVRLIGVDTPETKDPRKPVQCFGVEASQYLAKLLDGQLVELKSDPTQLDRDKYDRLLRYVYLPDGTDVNLRLIEDGYAYEYTYQVPYIQQTVFKLAEEEAKGVGRGLWSVDTCAGQR